MQKNAPVESFDTLPDSAHVDVHVVASLFGCKAPTVWLRVRRGQLPAPHKFGMHTRWNVGELRRALSGTATSPSAADLSPTKAPNHSQLTSLRDQFAIAAMTGLLSAAWAEEERVVIDSGWATVAIDAYKMADAMIAARGSI